MAKKHSQGLQHKPFWASLAIVFLLSIITIITMQEAPALTGHSVQTISYLQSGQDYTFEIKEIPYVQGGSIKTITLIKSGKITFEENKKIPFQGTALTKFTVASPNEAQFGLFTLNVKLQQQKLAVPIQNVHVYVNDKEFPITLLKTEEGYSYAQAVFPFETGNYVVGRAALVEAALPVPVAEIVTPQEPQPAREEQPQPDNVVGEASDAPQAETMGVWDKMVQFFRNFFN